MIATEPLTWSTPITIDEEHLTLRQLARLRGPGLTRLLARQDRIAMGPADWRIDLPADGPASMVATVPTVQAADLGAHAVESRESAQQIAREERHEDVELLLARGADGPEIAERLGITINGLRDWARRYAPHLTPRLRKRHT